MSKTIYYAIGDIHGERDKLKAILDEIVNDAAREHHNTIGPKNIIFLGDYVDRGPDSKGVLDLIREFEQDVKTPGIAPLWNVVSLMGNHEDMFIKAVRERTRDDIELFLINGGHRTLESFGTTSVLDVPPHYIDWLVKLPYFYSVKEHKLFFVHAGVRPDKWPSLSKEVAIWSRSAVFFNDHMWHQNSALRMNDLNGWLFIHGHTPRGRYPESSARRINLDTGACFSDLGYLTAAKIMVDNDMNREVSFISVGEELKVERYDDTFHPIG